MSAAPKFTWTDRGLAFAKLWATPEEVISRALAEFATYEIDPEDLMFHTVFIGPVSGHKAFIIVHAPDGSLLIDAAIYEEVSELMEGPLKGYKVQMPYGASED